MSAIQVGPQGFYGVMLHNKNNATEKELRNLADKYGEVKNLKITPQNLVFIDYKEYQQARAFLDELENDPAYSARAAIRGKSDTKQEQEKRVSILRRSKSCVGRTPDSKKVQFTSESNKEENEKSSQEDSQEDKKEDTVVSDKKEDEIVNGDDTETSREKLDVKDNRPRGRPQEKEWQKRGRGGYVSEEEFRGRQRSKSHYRERDESRGPSMPRGMRYEGNESNSRDDNRGRERSRRPSGYNSEHSYPKKEPKKRYPRYNGYPRERRNSWESDDTTLGNFYELPLTVQPKETLYQKNGAHADVDQRDEYVYEKMQTIKKISLHCILLTNLPLWFMMGDVIDLCKQYCDVAHVDFHYSWDPVKPPHALVHVKSKRSANILMDQLHNKKIDFKLIGVQAISKDDFLKNA